METNHILLVEDDKEIREGVEIYLKSQGYEVFQAADGIEGLKILDQEEIHLAIVDVMMPRMDGITMTAKLREKHDFPVIFLSAKSEEVDKILGLNMGADDFIAKPFDLNVLIAKIQALLRRTYDFGNTVPVLEHRGAILNTGDNTLTYREEKISLTKNEYRILLALMENKGKVVSRERLMERLWETDCFVDDNTLTVNINRLRKKLDGAGLEEFIVTKFGRGYLVE